MKFIGAVVLLLVPLSAQAQLLGATVDVTARYPTVANIYAEGGVATVGADIEYPAGAFAGYNPSWEIDITDNQLSITNTTVGFPSGEPESTGGVLTVLWGPPMLLLAANRVRGSGPFDASVLAGTDSGLTSPGVA